MITIYALDKTPVSRSKNLRGIRAYAGKWGVRHVYITRNTDSTARLVAVFENDAYATAEFASKDVLQSFLRNWRNARGAELTVDGFWRGWMSTKEPVGY